MLIVEDLSVSIGGKLILDSISLEGRLQEITALLGPSGSGKSTFLRSFFPKAYPEMRIKGSINWDGSLPPGYVGQDPFTSFSPYHNLERTLEEPQLLRNEERINFIKKRDSLLDRFSLNKSLIKKYPKECSGGELQRIAILRAVLFGSPWILMDEPFTALDRKIQYEIVLEIQRLIKEEQVGIFLISHDLELIHVLSNKIYNMEKGKITNESIRKK